MGLVRWSAPARIRRRVPCVAERCKRASRLRQDGPRHVRRRSECCGHSTATSAPLSPAPPGVHCSSGRGRAARCSADGGASALALSAAGPSRPVGLKREGGRRYTCGSCKRRTLVCETCPDAMVQASHRGGACNRHTRVAGARPPQRRASNLQRQGYSRRDRPRDALRAGRRTGAGTCAGASQPETLTAVGLARPCSDCGAWAQIDRVRSREGGAGWGSRTPPPESSLARKWRMPPPAQLVAAVCRARECLWTTSSAPSAQATS